MAREAVNKHHKKHIFLVFFITKQMHLLDEHSRCVATISFEQYLMLLMQMIRWCLGQKMKSLMDQR